MSQLERFAGRVDAIGPRCGMQALPHDDGVEDCSAFGLLRGPSRERAVMLELRKKNGDVLAIGCGWIECIEYNASEGITLKAAGRTIRIRGRSLNVRCRPGVSLFEGLARQRISWIQEADEPTQMNPDPRAITVDCIDW